VNLVLKLNGHEIDDLFFPNQEVLIRDFRPLIESHRINQLEFKFNGSASLFELEIVGRILRQQGIKTKLFIWYMPYSRMDHEMTGDIQTLPYVCDIINELGFVEVVVMEPHSVRTLELLNNSRAISPVTIWLPQIQAQLGFDAKRDHIVFPDKGAAQRYQDCGFNNVIVFDKVRDTSAVGRGKITDFVIKSGQVNSDAKCIIIDDLCVYGGTFMACGKRLRAAGAQSVALVVAHLETAAYNPMRSTVLSDDSPIDKVFASRSIASDDHNKVQFMEMEVPL
jgi:ribose-phosphate pyrophosphokinase